MLAAPALPPPTRSTPPSSGRELTPFLLAVRPRQPSRPRPIVKASTVRWMICSRAGWLSSGPRRAKPSVPSASLRGSTPTIFTTTCCGAWASIALAPARPRRPPRRLRHRRLFRRITRCGSRRPSRRTCWQVLEFALLTSSCSSTATSPRLSERRATTGRSACLQAEPPKSLLVRSARLVYSRAGRRSPSRPRSLKALSRCRSRPVSPCPRPRLQSRSRLVRARRRSPSRPRQARPRRRSTRPDPVSSSAPTATFTSRAKTAASSASARSPAIPTPSYTLRPTKVRSAIKTISRSAGQKP